MIHDHFGALPSRERTEHFRSRMMAVRSDEVLFPDQTAVRHYVVHFGAVAVVALDDEDRAVVILQYRHPVAARTWEIPAGLLDEYEFWVAGRGE